MQDLNMLTSSFVVFNMLMPIFFLIVFVMLLFIPFWILRIRNEVIDMNKKMTRFMEQNDTSHQFNTGNEKVKRF